MGEVYRARDERLGREVALKVLPAEFATDQERRARFEQEARAASALNHPNIVTVHDIGSVGSSLYVAMELVDGKTLREMLAAGPLPVKRVLDLGVQVADGLAKAHAAGIVHRDLKPENVMVSKDGFAKILDFGLAKVAETSAADLSDVSTRVQTGSGLILGTVGYMSPEQAAGHKVDFRSDQFALGTILYEAASGQRAFQRKTAAETLTAILREQPEPLARLNPLVPAPLRWIIEDRLLTKDPDGRYASTRDLLQDLRDLREHVSEILSGSMAAVEEPKRRWSLGSAAALLAALALGLGTLMGYRLGTRKAAASSSTPAFHQLTFRRGTIWSARFSPDGETVVYGAAWDGRPVEPFLTRMGTPESRPVGYPGAEVLAVSSSGELAISLDRRYTGGWTFSGTLARVAMTGGAPRQVLEDVEWADWGPDGLAVVRCPRKCQLEYPIGKVLYETAGWLSHPRVAPKGNAVAFLEHPTLGDDAGRLALVDRAGAKKDLGPRRNSAQGVAWAPSGDEVWYTSGLHARGLWAATPAGVERQILSVPGTLTLHDISRDGRVLLARESQREILMALAPGETKERDLSWLDWSIVRDLSPDGRTLLIDEEGEGAGPEYSVYVRRTDGSPAVHLGDGYAQSLSPDGKWVASFLPTALDEMRLLPTGPGETKRLPKMGLTFMLTAGWLPDGSLLTGASEPGRAPRVYRIPVDGGKPTPVTPEGIALGSNRTTSPDGKLFLAHGPDDKPMIYSIDGGEPRPVPGLAPGDVPTQWSGDGRALYVFRRELPYRVFRIDLQTGKRELWKETMPEDPAGILRVRRILITPDGKSYAYGMNRILSELYLVEGRK